MKTKELILEKTLGLLLEKGYDGVSVSDICQVTGISRGLLYHYFRNKEDLFEEIICEFYNRHYTFDREVLKTDTISERIVFTTRFFADVLSGFPEGGSRELFLTDGPVLIYQAALHSDKFAKQLKKNKEDWFAVWKTAVLNSFAKGELRNGLNLESVARHFVYIVQGVISATTKNNQDTLYEIEKSLWEFFEMIKR